MAVKEISFPSYNGRDVIKGWIYTPIGQPRAIVQIVHGFGEHSRRYLHLIMRMVDAGCVVCADDHVGHGKTAADGNSWGDYGYKGYSTTTEDEHTLHNLVLEQYPNLPYFIFGHSWGSMIARDYAACHGEELRGAIFCGTASLQENTQALCDQTKALVEAGRGSEVIPELVGELLKDFNSRYDQVDTPNDWIATDAGVVQDHATDPFNNFVVPPNVQAIYDFAQLWVDICNPEWAAKVPNIPILVIAGDQDPVGNYGEGVYQMSNWLWASGKNRIKTRVYSGYRHEIHNEPDIRDEVEAGIIDFISKAL